MDSRKLATLCRTLADNRKAEQVAVLDVRKLSSVTDYFVICSGTSEPHLRAIRDEITDRLREDHDVCPRAVDGTLPAGWVVLDYFDVIVHVMRQDQRERYDLEGLWGDAPRLHQPPPRRAVTSSTSAPARRPRKAVKDGRRRPASAPPLKPEAEAPPPLGPSLPPPGGNPPDRVPE